MADLCYLNSVRPKVYHDWTPDEMIEMYVLRRIGWPVSRIAHKSRFNKVQIHNTVRRVYRVVAKECIRCGHELKEDEQSKNPFTNLCHKCKRKTTKYKRILRKKALKEEMCGYCGIEVALPGFKACEKCISASYRRALKRGLCGRCGKNPIKSSSMCSSCLEKTREYSRQWRRLNRSSS